MIRTLLLVAVAALAVLVWWKPKEAAGYAERVPVVGPQIASMLGSAFAPAPARPAPRVQAVPVVLAKVERKSLPVTIDAVGTVQSVASIPIKSRTDSQITAIEVEEGALVNEGDLLVTLDSRVLKAQLAQSEAMILKGKAQIEQARRDLARLEDLFAKRIGTEVQRDTAGTQVKVQQAQVAADEATRDSIAASLTYTEIRAPISGRIGSIAAKVGTMVRNADTQPIMTVNQVDPIYVSFAVPQSLFGDLRTALTAGRVDIEARVGPVKIPGTVSFVENTVDLATGTVLAKALMANKDERLWPGAFVSVQATLGIQADALAVPSSAVQLGQQGAYVFVVEGNRARLVPVTVERVVGGETVVSAGLKGGEQVVVDGQFRLVNGGTVQVQPGSGGPAGAGTDRAGEASVGGAAVPAPAPRRS